MKRTCSESPLVLTVKHKHNELGGCVAPLPTQPAPFALRDTSWNLRYRDSAVRRYTGWYGTENNWAQWLGADHA